jgi:hypothetical protein
MAQVLEYLPSKYKALSSNLKKKITDKEGVETIFEWSSLYGLSF